MPELPEVETIKNELAPLVAGRRIEGVDVLWHGTLRGNTREEFRSGLTGRRIAGLGRRGKYLLFKLEGSPRRLIVHLKMSGSLLIASDGSELPRYTVAFFRLDNGTTLFFRDPRKFGRLWLAGDRDILDRLGPEPLQPAFTPRKLSELLKKRRAPVKALLLDQEIIAGIGNMYADEALFAARIHPLRLAYSLSAGEVKRLHGAIQQVLRAGIAGKGASIVNYYRPGGETGSAHEAFKVAHRRGESCPVCGTSLGYMKVRGRGTYFCPKCQKEPPPVPV